MNVDGTTRGRSRAWMAVLATLLLAATTDGSAAAEMFKCGKVIQDRPCESTDVQQRFSSVQGTFSIEQVNAHTDRDCAQVAGEAIVWWRRMARGEPMDKLLAEMQEQKISRYNKSVLRDVLIVVKNSSGTEREVRSQFETQCMAYKRSHGYATEAEMSNPGAANARVAAESDAASRRALAQAEADARRAEFDARRAEMEARAADARARAAAARSQQH